MLLEQVVVAETTMRFISMLLMLGQFATFSCSMVMPSSLLWSLKVG
jgi:hypothetical protein